MNGNGNGKRSWIKRFLPLCILLAAMLVLYLSGVTDMLDYETLKLHRMQLMKLVEDHFFLMSLAFIFSYILFTALSVPGAVILSILGGFLFPMPLSAIYVVLGATFGATILFLIAKTALGEFLRNKAGKFMKKMEEGFKKNAWSYLLFLRFIPLFPFWIVNLAPAFFGVRLFTYFWTTFIGVIPGAYVFTQAGSGLGAILDKEGEFSLEGIFNVQIQIALIVLALFSLIPIFVKHFVLNRGQRHD